MGKKLFVGNLPFAASDENLVKIFSEAGKVESARVVVDKRTGRSKGFGFVEMSADAEAAEAIAKLNGADWEGRKITVSEAKQAEATQAEPGRRKARQDAVQPAPSSSDAPPSSSSPSPSSSSDKS